MVGPFEGLVSISMVGVEKAVVVHDGHFFHGFVLQEYASDVLGPRARIVSKTTLCLFDELSSSNKEAFDPVATVFPNNVANVFRSGRHSCSSSRRDMDEPLYRHAQVVVL